MHACHYLCTQGAHPTSSVHAYAIMLPTDSLRWNSTMLWSGLCSCALVDPTCRQSAFSGVQGAAMERGSPVFASALEAAILHTCGLSPRIFGLDIHFRAPCTESRRRCLLMVTRGKSVSQPTTARASAASGTGARMNQLWQHLKGRNTLLLSSVGRRQRVMKARSCHLWSRRSAHPLRRGLFRSSRLLMGIRARASATNASFVQSPSFAMCAE